MAPDGLSRAAPEDHGVSSGAIQAFLDDAARLGVELNSFMVWAGGDVIAEGWWRPYRADRRHMLHSATKSFVSAGIGLAVGEGLFALDDRVVDFFPDKLPAEVGENLAAMTVEDLLTQTSGHAQGASGSVWRGIRTSWITEFFKIPVVYRPGTHFRYTSATSFMLSAILSRTTGQSAHDYLQPRLFEPLGITDLTWDMGPEGINPGGNGISARTSDLLKLAVLHLRGGVWNGARLLSEDWVRRATSAQRGNAYGYHWWAGPGGAFYAYGIFGQFAVVLPEHDAVLVLTGAVPNGEETLRSLVWRHFPAMLESRAQPDRKAGTDHASWGALALLPPLAPTHSPLASEISGKTFEAAPNDSGVESFRLSFDGDRGFFELRDGQGAHRIAFGLDDWVEGDTTMPGAGLHHGYEPATLRVVAGGRWVDEASFEMTWQFVETAFRDRVVIRFKGDRARLDRSVNVNSGRLLTPTILAVRQ